MLLLTVMLLVVAIGAWFVGLPVLFALCALGAVVAFVFDAVTLPHE